MSDPQLGRVVVSWLALPPNVIQFYTKKIKHCSLSWIQWLSSLRHQTSSFDVNNSYYPKQLVPKSCILPPINRRVVQPVTWRYRTITTVIQLLFNIEGRIRDSTLPIKDRGWRPPGQYIQLLWDSIQGNAIEYHRIPRITVEFKTPCNQSKTITHNLALRLIPYSLDERCVFPYRIEMSGVWTMRLHATEMSCLCFSFEANTLN